MSAKIGHFVQASVCFINGFKNIYSYIISNRVDTTVPHNAVDTTVPHRIYKAMEIGI